MHSNSPQGQSRQGRPTSPREETAIEQGTDQIQSSEVTENIGSAAIAAIEALPNVRGVVVPDRLLSADEATEWAKSYGFVHKTRGTYHTEAKEAFVYIKGCLSVSSEDDVEPALAVVRHLTEKGILHPDTRWGAFKRNDKDFQLFPVSPGINPANLEALITEPGRFTSLRKPIDNEGSQILEWVRRLDPDYPTSLVDGRPGPDSLLHLLNLHEASRPDNWGYDDSGVFYPVDVEVINTRDRIDLVRQWYATHANPQGAIN